MHPVSLVNGVSSLRLACWHTRELLQTSHVLARQSMSLTSEETCLLKQAKKGFFTL